MSESPNIVHHEARQYVAVTARASMDELPKAIDSGFGEVFGWLARYDTPPAEAAFVRYVEVDMERSLLIELGVPVANVPPTDEHVHAGTLPAGDYVTLVHRGPYDELVAANGALQHWAEQQGLRWAMDGEAWRARIEQYVTDPREEPDPANWITEIAYLVES